MKVTVKFIPNDKGNPAGKLADAELLFEGGLLDGFKLIGFSVWERRGGSGRNLTFPARSYAVNGERRSFALLRPVPDGSGADSRKWFTDRILEAFAEVEQRSYDSKTDAGTTDSGELVLWTDERREYDGTLDYNEAARQ